MCAQNWKIQESTTTKGSALAEGNFFALSKKTRSECVQELYPLFRVEEHGGQPGLHAVSASSRWMSTCPLTGLTQVKSVLVSGAADSCAPDCMCPEVKSRPSEGSRRDKCTLQQEERKWPTKKKNTQWSLEVTM